MVDISSFTGGITRSLAKGATTFLLGTVALIFVCIVGFLLYRWYKNKSVFKTPVALTVINENGTTKTRYDLRGGVFWNKGIRDFKIKIPKAKPHILGYIPDMGKADGDGRLFFTTTGDRTVWQQYSQTWKLRGQSKTSDGKLFEYDLLNQPVPRETKQLTINAIKSWRETIDKQKLTAYGIAIGAFIIMVIAHLISLFIQARLRCNVAAG